MRKTSWLFYVLLVVSVITGHAGSRAQTITGTPREQPYSFRRSWNIFSEYSPGSSHIFLGIAREREFLTVGGAFTERFFLKHYAGLSYKAEIRPLMLESDPVINSIDLTTTNSYGTITTRSNFSPAVPVVQTGPSKISDAFTSNGITTTLTFTYDYSRRWTYVFGLSPVGLQANFLPRLRVQPVLTALGGFAVSPRDIPVFDSSAFNFTFSIGAGAEFFQGPYRATRLEYRIQHLSNKYIGTTNPGIDSQMIQASFIWGR
jgi:Lipid A 3-O-deacylase (PagL)